MGATDDKLDTLFDEKLGVKRQQLIGKIRLIQRMAWEQVLLVAYFARSECCKPDSGLHFRDRLRLLELAVGYGLENGSTIGQWLDEGLGFVAICKKINTDWGDKGQGFLSECERTQIVFPPLQEKLPYSHVTLLGAMQNIVPTLQVLLRELPPQELCDQVALKLINDWENDRKTFTERRLSHPLHRESHFSSVAEALNAIPDAPKPQFDILKEIERRLATRMHKAFDLLQRPHIGPQSGGPMPLKIGHDVAKFFASGGGDTINLTLDRTHLTRCMALGQKEMVMEAIYKALSTHLDTKVFRSRAATTPDCCLDTMADWQRKCGVLGLKKDSSIPGKVATLLDFDIRHSNYPLMFWHPYLKHQRLPDYMSEQDSALITTSLIERCLYYQEDVRDFLPEQATFGNMVTWRELATALTHKDNSFDGGEGDPSNETGAETRPTTREAPQPPINKLMEAWSNNDASKLAERFKRPRKRFEDDLGNINMLVRSQQAKGMSVSYPIEGPFPLPLWC